MMKYRNGEVLSVSEELLKCPFCGGEAELCEVETELDGKIVSGFIVACEECGTCTPMNDDEQKVITCWNNRVPSERENELEKMLAVLVNSHYDELNADARHARAIHQAQDFLKQNAG